MKKVLVLGSAGMMGSCIKNVSEQYPNYKYYFATRKDADLTKEHQVKNLIETVKPNYLINCSARVGGILGNLTYPAEYFYENILMNSFIIHYAYLNNLEKVIMFSSVCVFPDNAELLEEDIIHDGHVYYANRYYGMAKRMIDVQIEAYKKQYGIKNYTSIIPGNIFCGEDNYNPEQSHVIPGLIYRLYHAKLENKPFIVFGHGHSLREFLYAPDVAHVVLQLLEKENLPQRLIVSGEREYSIREIVDMLVEISGFKNEVMYDQTKPSGQFRRPSSKKLFRQHFPDFQFTPIYDGLKKTWEYFEQNYPNVRV